MPDPTAAYHGDNPESVAAWESVADLAETLRRQVVDYIDSMGGHGATCDEAEQALELMHQTCSARFTEAKKYGQIAKSGEKRMTRSGRWAAVYVTPRFHTGNIHRLPVRSAASSAGVLPPASGKRDAGGAGRDAAKPLATVPAVTTQHSTHSGETMSEGFDLGGGATSFAFDKPGDTVTGLVKDMSEVQSRDMRTGELAYWPDGRPKMMFAVTLQTELRDDPMDSGERAVYLNGSRKPESKSKLAAVLGAVKATTGGTQLQPGGRLTLTYTGDGPKTQAGFNPPKHYSAQYQPPAPGGADLAGSRQPAGQTSEPPF